MPAYRSRRCGPMFPRLTAVTGSDEGDELGYSDDDSRRSISPSKLTARQRAKYDKDIQETLLSLPGTSHISGVKLQFLHPHYLWHSDVDLHVGDIHPAPRHSRLGLGGVWSRGLKSVIGRRSTLLLSDASLHLPSYHNHIFRSW